MYLHDWLESFNLSVSTPLRIENHVQGQWAETCAFAPVTRVPTGDQDGLPSLLDFAKLSSNMVKDSFIDWHGTLADHALIGYVFRPKLQTYRKIPRTNFTCTDEGFISGKTRKVSG